MKSNKSDTICALSVIQLVLTYADFCALLTMIACSTTTLCKATVLFAGLHLDTAEIATEMRLLIISGPPHRLVDGEYLVIRDGSVK